MKRAGVAFVMSRNLTKTPAFKLELFLEHPKKERLHQTAAFKPQWRIVFLIISAIAVFFLTLISVQGISEGTAFPDGKYCKDSDGGIFSFQRGVVDSINFLGIPKKYEDRCLDMKGKSFVREYYCDNERGKWQEMPCHSGCDLRKCMPSKVSIKLEMTKEHYAAGELIELAGYKKLDSKSGAGAEKISPLTGRAVGIGSEGSGGGSGSGSGSERYCASTQLFAKFSLENARQKRELASLQRDLNSLAKESCSSNSEFFEEEVVPLIEMRKELLIELIRRSPVAALETKPLPSHFTERLSDEERISLLEDRSPKEGYFDIVHEEDGNGLGKKFHYYLRTQGDNQKKYEAFLAHGELQEHPGSKVIVQGLALDNVLALDDSPAKTQVIDKPITPAQENLGKQRVLVIVSKIEGVPAPTSVEEARKVVFEEVQGFYDDTSYGKTELIGKVIGPYDLKYSEDNKCNEIKLLLKEAFNRKDIESFDYDRLILAVPCTPGCNCAGGSGTVGKMMNYELPNGKYANFSASWDFVFSKFVVSHELGHNFGAHHANKYECRKDAADYSGLEVYGPAKSCENMEYGDSYDVMGGGGSFNAPHRSEAGWLSPENTKTIEEGTFVLRPLNKKVSPGTLQQIRIPVNFESGFYFPPENIFYTVELKLPSKEDKLSAPTVFLHLAKGSDDGSFTFLQTTLFEPSATSETIINPDGTQIKEIQTHNSLKILSPYIDPWNGVQISLVSISEEGAEIKVEKLQKSGINFQKPLVHYNFDEQTQPKVLNLDADGYSTGRFKDSSENGIYAKIKDKVLRIGGGVYVMQDSASQNYDKIPSHISLSNYPLSFIQTQNKFTVSLWVHPQSFSSLSTSVYSGKGISIHIMENGGVWASSLFKNVLYSSPSYHSVFLAEVEYREPLKLMEWHHIVVRYDGSEMSLFVDGVLRDKKSSQKIYPIDSSSESKEHPLTKVHFGRYGDHILGPYYSEGIFNGVLDEFSIYARALEDKEVASLYSDFSRQSVDFSLAHRSSRSFIKNDLDEKIFGSLRIYLENYDPITKTWSPYSLAHRSYFEKSHKIILPPRSSTSIHYIFNSKGYVVWGPGNYRVYASFEEDQVSDKRKGKIITENYVQFEVKS
ncbi:hypothetical protein FJZ18_02725 [Candidatus Pacearchaeota archaeon]|nr:hypothetical protein [Candidatus Pacearchaeota archaeon]